MANPSSKELQRLFAQLMRIEEHRSRVAEIQIRQLYKDLEEDLLKLVGGEYAKYADGEEKLTYLGKASEKARFLETVSERLRGLSKDERVLLRKLCEDTYTIAFEGVRDAVDKAVDNKALHEALKGIKLVPAEVIKAAVTNPVAKLTLDGTLEKNRKIITYKINKAITNGIMNGDRLSTMAKHISRGVNFGYNRSMLIARTEAHRVREIGHNDSSGEIDKALADAGSEYRMVKVWRNMQDERVRFTKLADHVHMEGQTVQQSESFDLKNGVTAPCPGQSGTAYNDCNCRCYVSHRLMTDEEFFQRTGRHFENENTNVQLSESAFKALPGYKRYVSQINKGIPDRQMAQIIEKAGEAVADIEVLIDEFGRYTKCIENKSDSKLHLPKITEENAKGMAFAFTHELGHFADDITGGLSNSEALKAAIKKSGADMSNNIRKLFNDSDKKFDNIMAAELKKADKEYIEYCRKAIESGNYGDPIKVEREIRRKAQIKAYELAGNDLFGVPQLEDIYDALSGGRLRSEEKLRFGHGETYYRKSILPQNEIWADYCALELGNKDLIEVLRNDKPILVDTLDKIKNEMLEMLEKLDNNVGNGIIKTGAKSGALNPESKEAADHAERYYTAVRKMKTDVKRIAQNTGFSEELIQSIKDYVFVSKHDLGDRFDYFDPDYDMAQSWQRLIEGKNILSHDLTLLKHEKMEKELIAQGMSQDEAHIITSKTYNYQKEVEEYHDQIKKHKT